VLLFSLDCYISFVITLRRWFLRSLNTAIFIIWFFTIFNWRITNFIFLTFNLLLLLFCLHNEFFIYMLLFLFIHKFDVEVAFAVSRKVLNIFIFILKRVYDIFLFVFFMIITTPLRLLTFFDILTLIFLISKRVIEAFE
jgi:hypothetical protein